MELHPPQNRPPRILFLFSDTGGGHRSGAEAIIEALHLEFGDRVTCKMVDFFRYYTPPPFKYAPEIYPRLSRMTHLWGLTYHMSDDVRRTRMVMTMVWPYVTRSLNRLVRENPSDLIVSVHQLPNTTMVRLLKKRSRHVPFATVVLDMVSTHAAWYDPHADLVLVPTPAARQRALECRMPPNRVQVVGMPVAQRFCQPVGDRDALRSQLGWWTDRPVYLLVGGGEGMGPLEKTALAIDQANLPAAMVIVAGRNQRLKEKLEKHAWKMPVKVYGFVREMPDFMRAADVLITKAGPGTISEAFIANLPIILYSRVPGQEEGNVDYVVTEGAGLWAPEPEQVAAALKRWTDFPMERQAAVNAATRLARPEASREIARRLAALVGL